MGRLYGPLRILLVVLAVLTITSSVAFAEGEDEYYLTWEEYITANEIESWNWNDAADAIEIIANHAIELYEAGDQETAYEYAKATYWGYYETTGFERNTMTYISGSRVSAVELQFTNFRKSIKKDLGAETVRAEGEGLIRSLHEDALILSPEGSSIDVSAGASSGGAVATFIGSLAIIVREGSFVSALNDLLHQYGAYIIGRMGVPYRARGVNIISVAIDAPADVISALSGKLGRLPGVTAKTVYAPEDALT